MKYMYSITLFSFLFTLALAAPRPITLICETSSGSPTVSDVQALANHFMSITDTCIHAPGTGSDNCEEMYQSGKAGIGICGPIGLFPCHTAYDVITHLLDFQDCIQTYGGVQRVGGKALLPWGGVLNVYTAVPKAGTATVPDSGPTASLVLDTPGR